MSFCYRGCQVQLFLAEREHSLHPYDVQRSAFWSSFLNSVRSLCVVYNLSTYISHLGQNKHSAVFQHQVQDKLSTGQSEHIALSINSHITLDFQYYNSRTSCLLDTGIIQIHTACSSYTYLEQDHLMSERHCQLCQRNTANALRMNKKWMLIPLM